MIFRDEPNIMGGVWSQDMLLRYLHKDLDTGCIDAKKMEHAPASVVVLCREILKSVKYVPSDHESNQPYEQT